MKIVMFSMTPLFPDRSMGGAQKQLKKVALHLAASGHEVTILCTRRADAAQPFHWHTNLQVVPTYRFKQPFPEPYATPVYHIANAIQDTRDYLAGADRFYSHDGGLIFPYVYADIPTVISLRSVLFSETLQSAFLFQGDALILPSAHTAAVYRHTVGRFFPGLAERIRVIHNGLDPSHYRPVSPPRELLDRLPVDPQRHAIVLYPHRPEAPKGIRITVDVVDRLVHTYGLEQVRVLVPQWIDVNLSPDVRAFYQALQADIAARGLAEHFVFHDWIGDDEMPAYYSLGTVMFALGNYVETFGNTPYEALACGTPVVAARVGPYRDMLPEAHVALVDYGDVDAAAAAAAAIIQRGERAPDAAVSWVHTHFSQAGMAEAYADVILNAGKREPLAFRHTPADETTDFMPAPWCYDAGSRGIFHDFLGDYATDPDLLRCFRVLADRQPLAAADRRRCLAWYREGYFVPVLGER